MYPRFVLSGASRFGMGAAGHGSKRDLADGLRLLADRVGLLEGFPEIEPQAATSLAPSRRGFGSIGEAVSIVLGSAGELRTRDVHAAVEGLLEESVSLIRQELSG